MQIRPLQIRNLFLKSIVCAIFYLHLYLSIQFCHSQSYLGKINGNVNLRIGLGKENEVISTLKKDRNTFITSIDSSSNVVNINDIENDKGSFVHKSFIQIGKEMNKYESGVFSPIDRISLYNPKIEINNNTSSILNLKLNENIYSFLAPEKKSTTLSLGVHSYRASAHPVIPDNGNEFLQSNTNYTRQFYITLEIR